MASTPPAQIHAEARTPPTPLHGSAYHSISSPSRYNTRSSTRKTPDSSLPSFTQSSRPSRTPHSPQSTSHLSPQTTPNRKSSRRLQVMSPTSPDSIHSEQLTYPPHNPSYLSATTLLSEGMLPTPVKTPQKKPVTKSNMAARALFQDQAESSAMFPSPRKSQKKKVRHNGFSLESFSENITSQGPIQIHIDSRDQVPEVDVSDANPFYVASDSPSKKRTAPSSIEKAPTPSKRRKVGSTEKKPIDPQVEEAIRTDEGMVYVFRGKKVYRRFEDAGDEEEEIEVDDPEELGLLQHHPRGATIVKPLKTLTRKSIKPRRLFQDDKSHPQPTQTDEEAETEIEDNHDHIEPSSERPSPSRATRSRGSASSGSKKGSPFDTWPRLKSGTRSSTSLPATKGKKRSAAEALEA